MAQDPIVIYHVNSMHPLKTGFSRPSESSAWAKQTKGVGPLAYKRPPRVSGAVKYPSSPISTSNFIDVLEYRPEVITSVLPVDQFRPPTVALERHIPVALPSIHKILGPLYILLAMFGIVTAVTLSAPTVTLYHFIAASGPLLTVVAAIVYLWTVYQKIAK